MFAVRITRDFGQLVPFFERFSSTPSSVCVVFQHDADEEVSRTHVHALMTSSIASTDTLKRWIKDVVGPVERYDWSFTTCRDPDVYVTYMSKGKLDPVFVRGMDMQKVTELRAKWVEPQSKTSPREEKPSEVTAYSMAEELAKWIDMDVRDVMYDPIGRKWMKVGEDISERDVVMQCIKIHNKYRKGYCDFSLVRVIQTAYGMCAKERFRDLLVGKVLEKLSPRIV